MQGHGYIIDRKRDKKIKVLWRQDLKKPENPMYLKLRKSGKDGRRLRDQEDYLNTIDGVYHLIALKDGQTICI